MAHNPNSVRGIASAASWGVGLIALACGLQALLAPTVRLSCPARTVGAPDCELRWLVAFDRVRIRRTLLPGLQSVDEIESTSRGGATRDARSGPGGPTSTMYLNTASGRVRTILFADQLELQGIRDPLRAYLANDHAPPLNLTMRPDGIPGRLIANVIVCAGLLFLVWLPVQVVAAVRRRR